jgi:hypothetical protein
MADENYVPSSYHFMNDYRAIAGPFYYCPAIDSVIIRAVARGGIRAGNSLYNWVIRRQYVNVLNAEIRTCSNIH